MGFVMELGKLYSDEKGKGTNGRPMRPKVLKHCIVADCLVVVKK